jgi:hypothetical protein
MDKQNGYIAYYNGKQREVYASTSYEAQLKAVELFKPRKSQQHMVHVQLCELNTSLVIGTSMFHKAVE